MQDHHMKDSQGEKDGGERSGMIPLWEYCEVAWASKQIIIHVYSGRSGGNYEGIFKPEEWGTLLAQLGADGWELVGGRLHQTSQSFPLLL